MTTKLYNISAYDTDFSATVLAVTEKDGAYHVVLDRTLFFPEAGGQSCDRGELGGIPVSAVTLSEDGSVTHILAHPLAVGDSVNGHIDFAFRFRNMQHHTGEHILSGLAHKMYGYENVGFHLSENGMTLDFDRPLPEDDFYPLEQAANEAITRNLPVTAFFPSAEEASMLTYRAKKEILDELRLVRIEGIDLCACCAPHVKQTGEVGVIKVLSYMHHKGGCRLTVTAGLDAYLDYKAKTDAADAISRLLSVPTERIYDGVSALNAECARLRSLLFHRENEWAIAVADGLLPTDGNRVTCLSGCDARLLREIAVRDKEKVGGITAVLSFDEEKQSYRYAIASKSVALFSAAREINAALSGRGGGNDGLVQGNFAAPLDEIKQYLMQLPLPRS